MQTEADLYQAQRLGLTGRLSMASARHPWLVIGAWLAALVAITAISVVTGSRLTTDISFSNAPESQVARELLQDARGGEPFFEQVIVQSDRYTVDDPQFQAFATEVITSIRSLEGVIDPMMTFSYFEMPDPASPLVSGARDTTIMPALLIGDLDEATANVATLEAMLHDFNGTDGFTVITGGFASINEAFIHAAESDLQAEIRAIPFALIILIIVFGAVVAALLPLSFALLAIGITFGLIAIISQVFEMSFFVTNVMIMIGLAVGIDYALFVLARYREQRRTGQEQMLAIGVAGDTAARAVIFSGVTVVIALMGMFVVPTSIFQSFAIGASAVVLVTIIQSVTLLPAVVRLLGDRINRLSIPFFRGNGVGTDERGYWAAAVRIVMRYPKAMAFGSTAFLVLLAIPYLDISLGASGASSLPERFEARQAFDILDQEFSAGRIQPTDIVIQAEDVHAASIQTAIADLRTALAGDSRYNLVDEVQVLRVDLATFGVAVPGDNSSDIAIEAMKFIRTDLVPQAFNGVAADVYVGGPTAGNSDFFDLVGTYTPLVFAFVLGFSFVLLTVIFRSLVIPVMSIIMNLLSVGAAYGVVVMVFQWGWGADLFGFTQVDHIEAWLPLFMFTILFGLSMDYHIFLLSRIRERYDETGNNSEAVAHGLRRTANIITGAAAIMVVVFGGFALGELPMFQQIGLGLAVSVFLDASVVRMVLVPSTMRLLGDHNWYLPSWLRWMPDLRVERESMRVAADASDPTGATAIAAGSSGGS